jgi:predicted RNA-binding Zn ribbon-like protein
MSGHVPFLWIGNHPATDLCNTEPVIEGDRVELLPDFDALVTWARRAGVLANLGTGALSPAARRDTLAFVHRLRAALRHPLESGHRDTAALRRVNQVVAEEAGVLYVSSAPDDPIVLRAPTIAAQLRLDVAAAVLDVFRYEPRLVRRCANPECVLLFLDVSKTGRRRWCDMATCGNRAKAAAHYARRRDVRTRS